MMATEVIFPQVPPPPAAAPSEAPTVSVNELLEETLSLGSRTHGFARSTIPIARFNY